MALWYAARATGIVSLLLLSAVVVLGLLTAGRRAPAGVPRYMIIGLHRSLSLLSVVFVGVHVASLALDTYVDVNWTDAVLPFLSGYQPLWTGLGTVAADLLAALVITSLLRARLGHRTWRSLHWLSYAFWPVAALHGLGAGTDQTITLVTTVTCLTAVAAAAIIRWSASSRRGGPAARPRTAAGGPSPAALRATRSAP